MILVHERRVVELQRDGMVIDIFEMPAFSDPLDILVIAENLEFSDSLAHFEIGLCYRRTEQADIRAFSNEILDRLLEIHGGF